MDLELLPSIILAIAEQRSLNGVLDTIIKAVARQSDVALARLWLLENDGLCPQCRDTSPTRSTALHLMASAGTPREPEADWSRINGRFHRVPLESDLKLAYIARTGLPIRILDLAGDREWIREPQWVQREGLVSFAARPLVSRGEILGVLGVFRRVPADDRCWEWLRVLADAAAVSVGNTRAFDQAEALRRELELERDYLREEVQETGAFGEILGRSGALNRVLHQVEMVASTDANVLILGESGTGKELIARAIHQRSPRTNRPLVKVNCGSVPRELFESEFFGHARGSFTGAIRDRIGRFQLADGGTLFLDEIGEIPVDLQPKLLRVLQEGEFERIGEDTTRKVNVRVLAATNRDLRKGVTDGQFRLDLYYRLAVFPLQVPPLRERRDDIPELASHFVSQACVRFHLPKPRLSQRELRRMQQYDWPGNVRELQNAIERAVILARGGPLTVDLGNNPGAAPGATGSQDVIAEAEWREREKANLLAALRRTGFRISGKGGAAELLGINPGTLASRLKALGSRRQDYPS